MPQETLVTLARFEWQMEANMARSRLAASGIESYIAEEVIGTVCWYWAKALGGIQLQVSSADLEDARAIVEKPWLEEGEPVLTETEQKADRALRGAVLGVVAFPVQLYASWLLINIVASREPLDPRERRQVIKAAMLNLPLLILPALAGAFPWLRRIF
jgi:hypothetical protein